jgi:hypothetical protein
VYGVVKGSTALKVPTDAHVLAERFHVTFAPLCASSVVVPPI